MKFFAIAALLSTTLSGAFSNPIAAVDAVAPTNNVVETGVEGKLAPSAAVTVVVGAIVTVTDLSADLTKYSETITIASTSILTAPRFAYEIGVRFGKIGFALRDLTAVLVMPGQPKFNDLDASAIVVVLTKFVQVHQNLLQVIIGKHSILARYGGFVTFPVLYALRTLEGVIDAFAIALIGLIPTRAPQAEMGFASLTITLKAAQTKYM